MVSRVSSVISIVVLARAIRLLSVVTSTLVIGFVLTLSQYQSCKSYMGFSDY
jgi:hypothetical protein